MKTTEIAFQTPAMVFAPGEGPPTTVGLPFTATTIIADDGGTITAVVDAAHDGLAVTLWDRDADGPIGTAVVSGRAMLSELVLAALAVAGRVGASAEARREAVRRSGGVLGEQP